MSLSGGGTATSGAVSSLAVNSHTVTATYSGDTNFSASIGASTQSVAYLVGGACDGAPSHQILQPINSDGTSVFKGGSTVPIKFRVCDWNGNSIGTGTVALGAPSGSGVGASGLVVNETVASTTPDTAFRWDSTNQQWIYNQSTKGMTMNAVYTNTIQLNDGTRITYTFGLR